eukprot:2601431-Alexandrium_andersonii.AAC.1
MLAKLSAERAAEGGDPQPLECLELFAGDAEVTKRHQRLGRSAVPYDLRCSGIAKCCVYGVRNLASVKHKPLRSESA